MRAFLCWLFGHDRMTTSARQRICLRCGTRETRQYYGTTVGWEEVRKTATRSSRVW